MQRWKIGFSRGEETKYISHLDLMRAWVRILRRAGLRIAYSQGFVPHPRLSFAAPLAVGVTSEGELLEVFIEDELSPEQLQALLRPQMPDGFGIQLAGLLTPEERSLAARVVSVDYRTQAASSQSRDEVEERIATLLAAERWPRRWEREGKVRHYDLRPLVDSVTIAEWNDRKVVEMRLRVTSEGTGRPEEVLRALALEPLRLHRLRLGLAA